MISSMSSFMGCWDLCTTMIAVIMSANRISDMDRHFKGKPAYLSSELACSVLQFHAHQSTCAFHHMWDLPVACCPGLNPECEGNEQRLLRDTQTYLAWPWGCTEWQKRASGFKVSAGLTPLQQIVALEKHFLVFYSVSVGGVGKVCQAPAKNLQCSLADHLPLQVCDGAPVLSWIKCFIEGQDVLVTEIFMMGFNLQFSTVQRTKTG